MKERPIMFSASMVRALLAGAKTQTRRTLKIDTLRPSTTPGSDWTWRGQAPLKSIAQQRRHPMGCWQDVRTVDLLKLCPYGAPGDRLWVRETFAANVHGCVNGISYRADHIDPKGDGPDAPMKWTPAIHMPRAASRLSLAITGIRVERVQSISEADATAEGVTARGSLSAVDNFEVLWRSINGDASWVANPWVWIVAFNLVRVESKS